MVSTLFPRPIYSASGLKTGLKLGRIFSALRCAVRIRLLRARERERGRKFVWYLPVSGPPINGKTFPGRFSERVPGRETTLAALAAFRKATHPSVFVPARYSRVAGSKLPVYFGKLNRVRHVGLRP